MVFFLIKLENFLYFLLNIIGIQVFNSFLFIDYLKINEYFNDYLYFDILEKWYNDLYKYIINGN